MADEVLTIKFQLTGVNGLILFKVCMQVAYWPWLMICYMAFIIKGQSKAAAAFKRNFGVYLNDFFEAFSFQPGGWSAVKLLGFTCLQINLLKEFG